MFCLWYLVCAVTSHRGFRLCRDRERGLGSCIHHTRTVKHVPRCCIYWTIQSPEAMFPTAAVAILVAVLSWFYRFSLQLVYMASKAEIGPHAKHSTRSRTGAALGDCFSDWSIWLARRQQARSSESSEELSE